MSRARDEPEADDAGGNNDPWRFLRTDSIHKLLPFVVGDTGTDGLAPKACRRLIENAYDSLVQHDAAWEGEKQPLEVRHFLAQINGLIDICRTTAPPTDILNWESVLPNLTDDANEPLPKDFEIPSSDAYSPKKVIKVTNPAPKPIKRKRTANGSAITKAADEDDEDVEMTSPDAKATVTSRLRERSSVNTPSKYTPASKNEASSAPVSRRNTRAGPSVSTFTPASESSEDEDEYEEGGEEEEEETKTLDSDDVRKAKQAINAALKARKGNNVAYLSVDAQNEIVPQEALVPTKRYNEKQPIDGGPMYPNKAVVYWSHLPTEDNENQRTTTYGPYRQRYLHTPPIDTKVVQKILIRDLDEPGFPCMCCTVQYKECGPFRGFGANCIPCESGHMRGCTFHQTQERFDLVLQESSHVFSLGAPFQQYAVYDLAEAHTDAANAQRRAVEATNKFKTKLAYFFQHAHDIISVLGAEGFAARFEQTMPADPTSKPIVDVMNDMIADFNRLELEQFKANMEAKAKSMAPSGSGKSAS
ncbi:hypothetical protein DFH06DRAFT_1149807 [Mycena polygramma]|nr:hypothetical protein DFH06DRAFT_1149807 [Mycena polygramma]